MLGLGVVLIIVLLILLIVSIVAAILIGKMQKYQEYYSLLQESLVSFSFMAGVLWLIAGIMLLVRKPQTQNDQINSQYNDIHSHVVPEERNVNNNNII